MHQRGKTNVCWKSSGTIKIAENPLLVQWWIHVASTHYSRLDNLKPRYIKANHPMKPNMSHKKVSMSVP